MVPFKDRKLFASQHKLNQAKLFQQYQDVILHIMGVWQSSQFLNPFFEAASPQESFSWSRTAYKDG